MARLVFYLFLQNFVMSSAILLQLTQLLLSVLPDDFPVSDLILHVVELPVVFEFKMVDHFITLSQLVFPLDQSFVEVGHLLCQVFNDFFLHGKLGLIDAELACRVGIQQLGFVIFELFHSFLHLLLVLPQVLLPTLL